MDDLFLKIIAGDVPSEKVYEDKDTLAFLDINPHNHGHTLVIPKEKYDNIFDIPEETMCAMIKTAKKLSLAVTKATGAEGVNIGMNNGKVAGQEVMHAHIHIVPRLKDDNIYQPARHNRYGEGEKESVGEKIRKEVVKII